MKLAVPGLGFIWRLILSLSVNQWAMYLMLFCGSMVQPSRNGLVGGRSLSSLKQMFHKDFTTSDSLLNETGIQSTGFPVAIRPSINGSMTMIGVALTFGASVPLLSAHEPVLASDGSGISVISSRLASSEEGISSSTVAYYTVESGDSLWQIAQHHDADIRALETTNGISADEVLRIGQVLKVPPAEAASATQSSTPISGGVGGEFAPLASAKPGFSLGSAEDLRDGWATLESSTKVTPTLSSQPEASWVGLSIEASASTSSSKPSVAETLVSFSANGSLVPITYPEKASSSPETIWNNASTESTETAHVGNTQIALLQPEADSSKSSQSSSESEVRLAAADTYAAIREQTIRESLARIRESNTVTIDRDQLISKLALARQQLERSRTSESSPSNVLSNTANLPTSSEGTSLVASELQSAGSRSDDWVVSDVADRSLARTNLARSTSDSVDAPSTPTSSVEAGNQSLLAVAPLNPDIYRPLPSTSNGETVIPGMPMLPGAGEFLPQPSTESNGYVWPARGTFTSGYGWRWGRMHRGIDIAGPVGTPVVAAASGVVVRSGWNSGGYGNVVDIRHRDGSMTRYAHNSRLLVREGQQVAQGQSIAQMGSTGYSTGPHCHFEIHLPGNGTVNPIAYLPGR